MFKTLKLLFTKKNNDIRKRVLFTLGCLFVFIIGKTIPAILIALFDVTLMIIGSILLFKVPIEGSIFMIYFSVFVFLLAMSGIGLSLSTICKTQQQSVLGMCLLSAPLMMLSGFMSPIENMSWLAQKIVMINPLTYFFELLKGIFLRNIGMITIFENNGLRPLERKK